MSFFSRTRRVRLGADLDSEEFDEGLAEDAIVRDDGPPEDTAVKDDGPESDDTVQRATNAVIHINITYHRLDLSQDRDLD